jgi:8-oxo-dGTP diphosphatase
MTNKFRVVTNAIITNRGKILLGKKEEKEGHPVSGEWHFPGGHIDKDEEPEEAIITEVKEETSLDCKVHQLVDVTSNTGSESPFQVFYHLEAESREAKPKDDLEQVKWVDADKLKENLGETHGKRIEKRDEMKKFIERIEKAPY